MIRKSYLLVILLCLVLIGQALGAIRYASSSDRYGLLTGPGFPNTIMGWFKIQVDRNAYSAFYAYNPGVYFTGTNSSGTRLTFYNGGDTLGTDLTVGTWYHVATVAASGVGGARTVYLNGVSDIVSTGNETSTEFDVANDTAGEWLDGSFAAIKIFSAELSAAEILAESKTYMPRRRTNIVAAYPFISLGNGRIEFGGGAAGTLTLTGVGSMNAEGPPGVSWGRGQ